VADDSTAVRWRAIYRGCDIVREMNASGEPQSLISADHGTAT
jgi:hypothetical protein